MEFLFFTVADPDVGLGHLSRCDALAIALQDKGNYCRLIVSSAMGIKWLKEREPFSDFTVLPWKTNKKAFRNLSIDAAVVIIDAYDIDAELWGTFCQTGAVIAVFDDFGDIPPFDCIIINGSPGAKYLQYDLSTNKKFLLGVHYQVLRPPFWKYNHRKIRSKVEKIGIILGGTDHRNLIENVIEIISKTVCEQIEIIVIGMHNFNKRGIEYTGFLSAQEMKQLFYELDLLITAAGQTVAEAVSCGLPSIILQTAKNQEYNVKGWIETGAIVSAGSIEDLDWAKKLKRKLHSCMQYSVRKRISDLAMNIDLHSSTQRAGNKIIEIIKRGIN